MFENNVIRKRMSAFSNLICAPPRQKSVGIFSVSYLKKHHKSKKGKINNYEKYVK